MIIDRRPIIGSFAALIEGDPRRSNPKPTTGNDILVLTAQLTGNQPDLPVGELLEQSGLPLDQLGQFLTGLKKGGLIEMSGDWGRERVSISSLGKSVLEAIGPRVA